MVYLLFGPLDLMGLNAPDIPFAVGDVIWLVLALFVGVGAAITLIAYLTKRRAFDLVVSFVVGLALAGWLQANFLNPNLGQLMGDQIVWEALTQEALVNLIIWLVVIAVLPILSAISRRVWTAVVVVVMAVILTGSVIALAVTYSSPAFASGQPASESSYLSANGLYTVSASRNEVVFLLDEFDSSYIDKILAQDPAFFEPLTGFTRYTQNVTGYNKTFPSIASMLTGEDYTYATPVSQYYRDAWAGASELRALKAAGWSLNLYSDKSVTYWNDTDFGGLFDNFAHAPRQLDASIALNGLSRLTAFTYSPVIAKPSFWLNSSIFNNSFTVRAQSDPPYQWGDDPQFVRDLRSGGLRTAPAPRFSFIHLQGSHGPWTLDENGDEVLASTRVTQTMGILRAVFEYVDTMKQLGTYDNSTIIIMADHGEHALQDAVSLPGPNIAGLMVKMPGESTGAMKTSDAPVSIANFRPTLLAGAGLPYKGQTYAEVPALPNVRKFTWIRWASSTSPGYAQDYEISGDAREWGNWRLVNQYAIDQGLERQ
jgi:hypothetical protein